LGQHDDIDRCYYWRRLRFSRGTLIRWYQETLPDHTRAISPKMMISAK